MSVKNFKFVSPGVFINEIDNSFIPNSADAIGPVIIGRSSKGLAMTPVKVESFSEFVQQFGDVVPGGASGGDVYRYGNKQTPMYGTYAAKAFLAANVAPVTYMRVLGQQDTNASSTGYAGWKTNSNLTTNDPRTDVVGGGGAYGLWIAASGTSTTTFAMKLAAIIYSNSGSVKLSGSLAGGPQTAGHAGMKATASAGALVNCDSSGLIKIIVSSSGAPTGGDERTINVNFDDTSENFIRKKLNTNPQLMYEGAFYPTASETDYWLGETYEQTIRDAGLAGSTTYSALITGLALTGAAGAVTTDATNPAYHLEAASEAVSGWFIGQDTGPAASYLPEKMQKLFRLTGRGHGEWLHKNLKVSIAKIRKSNAPGVTDYGTFSVILRMINDTDNNVQVVERYDNLTLDPTSPNFIARRIGDKYQRWDTTQKRLREYGEYPNLSRYVYVDMNPEAEAGATDPVLLPFGYYGPPRLKGITGLQGSGSTAATAMASSLIVSGRELQGFASTGSAGSYPSGRVLTSSFDDEAGGTEDTLTFTMDHARIRVSASDGGLTNLSDAYFGFQTTRVTSSTTADLSVGDYHNKLYGGIGDDLTVSAGWPDGVEGFSYIFSMDDVASGSADLGGADGKACWISGTRANEQGYSTYTAMLDAGFDKFTAPFYGGFDGFDIKKPNPMYNGAMGDTSTEQNNYVYHTWRRAMDTVSDAEYVNMNILAAPGLTLSGLTTHMINLCEDRADALAVIDLPDLYIPPHEYYIASKANRIPNTPRTNANTLRDRRIDSSYGCTFYPWVQTRDDNTGILVWVPPSVAMLGVFGSSQAKSNVWFAPAGFNRGGLTEGAAGIPIVSVSERLTSKNRDILYDQNINPIASFPSTGLVVFGQKTLQQRKSALDRINVRRLVIYLKKQISIISSQILFEQNVEATWNRFKGLIEPFLANVKTQFGITDYKLILDETTTTPDLIDQNILYAKIMVKPARAIEFIAIDFVIASSGASFDD